MKYGKRVRKFENNFSQKGLLKVAKDLASVLDNKALAIEDSQSAEEWEKTFSAFCAVCVKSNVTVPPLDPMIYRVHLPKKDRDAKKKIDQDMELGKQIFRKVAGNRKKEALLCRSFVNTLMFFSGESEWNDIKRARIRAAINSNLVKLGIEPIRPDYATMDVRFPVNAIAPDNPITVLIFDDNRGEILNTVRRLAGWPNINFQVYLYSNSSWRLSEKEKEAEAKKMAEKKKKYRQILKYYYPFAKTMNLQDLEGG